MKQARKILEDLKALCVCGSVGIRDDANQHKCLPKERRR